MSTMKTGLGIRPMRGLAAAVLAVALGLSGCGAGSTSVASWDDEFDFGVPETIAEWVDDVPFYPACGNEVLTWDGERYYPYSPEHIDEFPRPATRAIPSPVVDETSASAVLSESAPGWVRMSTPIGAVAPPRPGDDTGTLVIFEGGHAYWESHNGELDTWLTTRELTYNWLC